MKRALIVAILGLLVPTLGDAKPASPLCFEDQVYHATWKLDTAQIGTHWTVAGQVDYGAGYPVPVFGSGVTTVSSVSAMLYTYIGGGAVAAILNLTGETSPLLPGANIHLYASYPTASGELYSYYWHGDATKVPCPN